MEKPIMYDDDNPTPPPFYEPSSHVEHPGNRSKTPKVWRILLIEDNAGDARLIRESLFGVPNAAFKLEHADRLEKGLAILAEGGVDLVLLDLSLPESWGINTLLRVQAQAPGVPIVVLTGLDDETIAITAVQQGAQDYLVKGEFSGGSLVRSVRYAIERARRRRAEQELRRTKEEFRIAHEIQQKLFPASAPRLAGFDIGGASFPAEATGGDYFDYVPMPAGCYGIVVGDVAGHGFGPALLMAETRAYLRALAHTHTDVSEMLTAANLLLVEDVAEGHFVTLFLGSLDPRTRSFVFASAGHPDGYILNESGNCKMKLESTGRPLGIERGSTFEASPPIRLEPGDLVFLITDGVLDAESPEGELFGLQRALHFVRTNRHLSSQEIVQALYGDIGTFCHGPHPRDDITAIVIKVLPTH